MRKLGVALLLVIGLVAIGGVALYAYLGAEYTVCYGVFESKAAAERAAEAGRDADFDADVDHREDDEVGPYWAVEFETGETGDDARESRRAFREALRRERGRFGHPDGGCLERTPFD